MANTTAVKQPILPSFQKEIIDVDGGSRKQGKKRRREEILSYLTSGVNSPARSPSKKQRAHYATNDLISNTSSRAVYLTLTEKDESGLLAEIGALEENHEVTEMNIISSSKIEAKVTKILQTLDNFSFISPCKPNITYLHAKGHCASKLISILEIAKRNIADEKGKWYQYNRLGESKEEKKREVAGIGRRLLDAKEVDEDEAMGDDTTDFQFETMKTPFERATEGKPKVRAVPLLGIYLSRVRVESLKKLYGEQTNALK